MDTDDLVPRYAGLLTAIADQLGLAPDDAADAAQTTWLAFVRDGPGPDRPRAVPAWLTARMRRACLEIRRRDGTGPPAGPPPDGTVEDGILRAERDRLLWDSVDRLPPRQREVVRALFDGRPTPYGEIAHRMRMPVGAIGPTRQRALRRLRQLLRTSDVN